MAQMYPREINLTKYSVLYILTFTEKNIEFTLLSYFIYSLIGITVFGWDYDI